MSRKSDTCSGPYIHPKHLKALREYWEDRRAGRPGAPEVSQRLYGEDLPRSAPDGYVLVVFAAMVGSRSVDALLATAAITNSPIAIEGGVWGSEILDLPNGSDVQKRLANRVRKQMRATIEHAYRLYKRDLPPPTADEDEDRSDPRDDLRTGRAPRIVRGGHTGTEWPAALAVRDLRAWRSGKRLPPSDVRDLAFRYAKQSPRRLRKPDRKRWHAINAALSGDDDILRRFVQNPAGLHDPLLAAALGLDAGRLAKCYPELGVAPPECNCSSSLCDHVRDAQGELAESVLLLDRRIANRVASREERALADAICADALVQLRSEHAAYARRRRKPERYFEISVAEVAHALGVSEDTINRAVADGVLKKATLGEIRIWERDAVRFVRKWFKGVRKNDLDLITNAEALDWLERRMRGGPVMPLDYRWEESEGAVLDQQIEKYEKERLRREQNAERLAAITSDDVEHGRSSHKEKKPKEKPAKATSFSAGVIGGDGPDKPDHVETPDGDDDTSDRRDNYKWNAINWHGFASDGIGYGVTHGLKPTKKDKRNGHDAKALGRGVIVDELAKKLSPVGSELVRLLVGAHLGRKVQLGERIPLTVFTDRVSAEFWTEALEIRALRKKDPLLFKTQRGPALKRELRERIERKNAHPAATRSH